MSKPKLTHTFMSRYLSGDVDGGEIDDFIDAWHERPGKTELFEFLGMSRQEYASWLRDPDCLPRLADARRAGRSLGGSSLASAAAATNGTAAPRK
jgi:hypothetical protein